MFERKTSVARVKEGHWDGDREWWLCYVSERLLKKAGKEGAVVIANDIFLVKFIGKLTALALENGVAKNGVRIQAGHWYSPVDQKSRDEIAAAFDNGETRVETDGTWAHMRKGEGIFTLRNARRFARK